MSDQIGTRTGPFLYELPPTVLWKFCRLMDGLSDLDWTRFASEVLEDQTAVRLAERRERRTEWVMTTWETRNGRVWQLIDLLERLQLLHPRDVILSWVSDQKHPPAAVYDPPPKRSEAPPTLSTCRLSTTDKGGGHPLPRPAPPPPDLQSELHWPAQTGPVVASSSGVMCWSYEEVHAGTEGFSPSLQVGEGGFGVVYRATLRNTDCAVKRLKQDCEMDWTLLRDSFQTEVDKLSKFRHPNIVDLLGFSEGGGSVCLIYSYMEKRSLEDQLRNNECVLSWPQRLAVVKGASAALQFLHSPPDGHPPLIHGDVKSSNILLDRHLEAKLADFGLARVVRRGPPGRSATQTASVGRTATVRGTLAYLPDEYVRNGELGTAVDVYSFGVVLLEVLTGRRALERHGTSDRYLKDLVEEVEDSPSGLSAASWRRHLDRRLVSGGAVEPPGCMQLLSLSCRSLNKKRKKRPAMSEVFDRLQDLYVSTSSSLSLPRPVRPLDSSVGSLSNQLSRLGPLEDTYQASPSSLCSLPPPHPLHSSSSSSYSSSVSSSVSSSLSGPCETDESRGFSQYDLRSGSGSGSGSNGTGSNGTRSLCPSSREQLSRPSVPTEDQYNFPPQPSGAGAPPGPDPGGQASAGLFLSPAGSLQSGSPGPSVLMNPSKQRFLQKKTLYDEGKIETPELLSSDDLYGSRGPEESDELDYLPVEHD
ncbi:interleukin-1 receptor-associated kinase 1 isoform X2 [Centropristis striata]|uniref:interleukin-1 receptor-associated kinase 1 isoform X2 n=1 Tax=Centropristis striata TaxID=184440 RepID=UPI0027E06D6B|nr:interleukin-1 receptor-associated kinase 1 isoform X2 [Centropristis striata]